MNTLIRYIRSHSLPLQPEPTGEEFITLIRDDTPRKIRAVLFDIYGTLFISASGDIGNSESQTEIDKELQNIADRFEIGIPGRNLPHLFRTEVRKEHKRLHNDGIEYPEIRVEEIWARILQKDLESERNLIKSFALSYEIEINPVYPMPGLAGVLENIRARGLAMGIVSNAQFFTPMLFPAFLGAYPENLGFEPALCFYSYEFRRGKPDSFMYEKSVDALRMMGIEPQETLYVGNDMRNDILPAISHGYQTALFAGDKRSLRRRESIPECREATPNYILSKLEDINSLI